MEITDNYRFLKRWLQGRGVNHRRTIVDGVAAMERTALPGYHHGADDRIISIIDWTDGADVPLSELDFDSFDEGDKATVTIFSGNKGLIFTAKNSGEAANLISVKAAAAPGSSLPLTVDIGPYDFVAAYGGWGVDILQQPIPNDHPGETLIRINLATRDDGVSRTDGTNSAANVKAAVEKAQWYSQWPLLFPWFAWDLVDVALTGDGSTDVTAQAVVPLVGGTPDGPKFNPEPDDNAVAASLTTDLSPYLDSDVIFTAKEKGIAGNDITVEYVAGGALTVEVTGTDIVVTYVVGETTAQDVIDAINDPESQAFPLVIASSAWANSTGSDTDEEHISGVISTMAQTPLTGGVDNTLSHDPGIRLTGDYSGKKLMIDWVSKHDNDADDE